MAYPCIENLFNYFKVNIFLPTVKTYSSILVPRNLTTGQRRVGLLGLMKNKRTDNYKGSEEQLFFEIFNLRSFLALFDP